MLRLLGTLAVLGTTLSIAHAHTQLSASMPANGATLAAAPKEIMLHFSEAVRLTSLSLQRSDGNEHNLAPLPPKADVMFTVSLPALATGQYRVSWRALAADAHVMTGTFSFAIGTANEHRDAPGNAHEHGADGPSH